MSLRALLQFCLSVLLLWAAPLACTPQLVDLATEGESTEDPDSTETSNPIDAGASGSTVTVVTEESSSTRTSSATNTSATASESAEHDAAVSEHEDGGSDAPQADAATSTAPGSDSLPDAMVTGDGQVTSPVEQIVLVASSPLTGDESVAVDAMLRLTFDRPVTATGGAIRLVTEDGMDTAFELDATASSVVVDGTQVSIPWGITLGYATWYWVEIVPDAFMGTDGVGFAGLTGDVLRFRTEEPPPIELQATFPESGTDAELDPTLTLVFNVDVVSATTGELVIYEATTDEEVGRVAVSDATQVQFDGGQVDVQMGLRLAYGTDYYVLLDEGAIVSTKGAVFEGITDEATFTFTTVDAPELVIVESSPVEVDVAASDVALSPVFVFGFSEPIAAGAGAFEVRLASDDSLVQQVNVDDAAVSIQGATLTIALPEALEPETSYYLSLDSGLVVGTEGGVFDGIQARDAFVFTTASAAIPSVVLTATVPIDGASDVAVNTSLTFTFDVAVEANQGSVSLHDADSGQTLVELNVVGANVEFTGNTMSVDLPQILPGSTLVEVRISPGAVVGTDGAPFPGLSGSDFTFETESSFGMTGLAPFEVQDADPATHLVLTFSAAPAVGTGTIEVRTSSGVIESITLPDARVTVSGTQATIDLDNILAGNDDFEVRVAAGAFVEADGNGDMLGIGAGAWTFGTASVTAPAGIGSGLVLWLDASYAPSVKGSAVSVWADRSGQYRNVVQTDGARRPALEEASMNGRSVIRFDGSNDVLRGLTLINLSNLNGFIVWRSPSVPAEDDQRVILVNDANFELNHSHPYVPSSLASCVGEECPETQWYTAVFAPIAAIDTTQVWNFGYSSSDTSMFARANAGATETQTGPSAPPSAATTPLRIGGEPANCGEGCYFEGDIAEILLYSTPLTDDQELAVLEYLYAKWRVASGSCDAGEARGPNGKCYFYDTATRVWQDSRTTCRNRGTGWDLAEIRSELDHRFVTEELLSGTTANVWLGAQDGNPTDTWRWLSDSAVFWVGKASGEAETGVFTAFQSDQPNDSEGSTRCMRYTSVSGEWGWSDADCVQVPATAICEGPVD